MAQGRRFCPQIGVDRGAVGTVAVAALVIAIRLASQQQKPRIVGPCFWQIGQVDGGPGKATGEFGITTCFGLKCGLQMLLCGKIVGDMGVTQTIGLFKRRRHIPIWHKRQFRPAQGGTVRCSLRRIDQNPRIGPQKERGRTGASLGKARIVVGVKGKRRAALVGGTSALTRLQRGVKRGRNIAPRKICILA